MGLVILLAMFLVACGSGDRPTATIIERAIALQVNQVQQDLGQQLYGTRMATVEPPRISVKHVTVTQRSPLQIEQANAYRVEGTADLTLEFADHAVTQRQTGFEVYLQRPSKEDSWQLARRPTGESGDRWQLTAIAP
ncbi:MAG TPA: hypothetical protein V6C88_03895 [Chroococcidiopsis sp.]